MEVVVQPCASAPQARKGWREYELAPCDLGLLLVRAHRETLHDEVGWDGWHRVWEVPSEASAEQIQRAQPRLILEKLQPNIGLHLDVPVNAKYVLVARLSRQRFAESGVLLSLLRDGHLQY